MNKIVWYLFFLVLSFNGAVWGASSKACNIQALKRAQEVERQAQQIAIQGQGVHNRIATKLLEIERDDSEANKGTKQLLQDCVALTTSVARVSDLAVRQARETQEVVHENSALEKRFEESETENGALCTIMLVVGTLAYKSGSCGVG